MIILGNEQIISDIVNNDFDSIFKNNNYNLLKPLGLIMKKYLSKSEYISLIEKKYVTILDKIEKPMDYIRDVNLTKDQIKEQKNIYNAGKSILEYYYSKDPLIDYVNSFLINCYTCEVVIYINLYDFFIYGEDKYPLYILDDIKYYFPNIYKSYKKYKISD